MGTGLLSQGTWAIHGTLDTISGSPIPPNGDSWIGMFPQRGLSPAPGSVNFFSPLEGKVLYMMIEVFSNSDNIGFEVELRRNAVSAAAKISFAPLETGRKALLLNIPFLDQEFMQWRIIKPQNFSIVTFQPFFAGKL